jgi:hypothetical protein
LAQYELEAKLAFSENEQNTSAHKKNTTLLTMKTLRNRFLPLLVALSAVHLSLCKKAKVNPRNCGGTPKHVHLSVGHDPSTQMIVTFASIPSNFPAPVGGVLVGTSPNKLSQVVIEEDSSSYNVTVGQRSSNYGSKYYSPYYHHVTISDLKPSTTYYYRPLIHASVKGFEKHNVRASKSEAGVTKEEIEVSMKASQHDEMEDDENDRRRLAHGPYDGSDKECPSSEKIRSFTTAPAPGSDASVSLAIMGDLGQFPHSEQTMTRLLRSKGEIDAMILAGDLGYTGTSTLQPPLSTLEAADSRLYAPQSSGT